MTLDWRDFPDAPDPGTILCDLDAVPESGVLAIDAGGFGVLALWAAGAVRAYVNACPHQYLPLNHRSDRLHTADGAHLACTNHGAVFRSRDGVGTAGEGLGCALSPIPTEIRDGAVYIR